jgi:K+-sensing histidine kinase KdpD
MFPDFQREAPPALRYGLAVAATAAAVMLGLLLRPLTQPSVLSPFFLAVVVTALYGGIGPGVLASLLSAAALNYWFSPPLNALRIETPNDIAHLLLFLVVAAVITWLGGTVRNQRWKSMQAGAVLRTNEEALRQVNTRSRLRSAARTSASGSSSCRMESSRMAASFSRTCGSSSA